MNSHRVGVTNAALFGGAAYMVSWVKHALHTKDFWTGQRMNALKAILATYVNEYSSYWHDYELHGLENVSANKCLLVGYHSRCTVDSLYLWCRINANFLISHVFFSIPGVRAIVKNLGAVPSKGIVSSTSDESFGEMLVISDRPMLLLPGGAYEAMKPWDKKHIVEWKASPGFARIIGGSEKLRSSIKVVPFYTKNSENIFYNFKWWFDFSGRFVHTGMSDAYNGVLWKMPFVLSVGIYSFGVSFLPRPVKLDTYFGEPLTFQINESVEQFAERVRSELQQLILRVNAIPERPLRNKSIIGLPYALYKGLLTGVQLSMFQLSNIAFFVSVLPVGLVLASLLGGIRRISK